MNTKTNAGTQAETLNVSNVPETRVPALKIGETMQFTCGHSAEEPRFMGRGQARVKRLQKYFARPCVECCVERAIKHMASLTDIGGSPRPADSERVAAMVAKIRAGY